MKPSPTESEIKLRVEDVPRTREALIVLGARSTVARVFEDNVCFDRDEELRSAGALLRVRQAGDQAVLTFKGPGRVDDGVKVRPELETAVEDAAALRAILEALGYRAAFRYQKFRETFSWGELEIVVDETPIGSFVELEGPPSAIHEAARALGKSPADYIAVSYAQLFRDGGGRGDMVFSPEASKPR